MTHHQLHIDKHWLDCLRDGTKTAEVRKHDRDFQIGDRITFTAEEFLDPFTFRPTAVHRIDATISHILPASVFPQGLQVGYSVLSLSRAYNYEREDLAAGSRKEAP